jgi:hypothetical protein
MISIDVPVGNPTPSLVRAAPGATVGAICAQGTATRDKEVLEWVKGKVYSGGAIPDADPPGTAITATLPGGDAWEFTGAQELPGAACAAAGFPLNRLRVWAKYQNSDDLDHADVDFPGQCSTSTDCD